MVDRTRQKLRPLFIGDGAWRAIFAKTMAASGDRLHNHLAPVATDARGLLEIGRAEGAEVEDRLDASSIAQDLLDRFRETDRGELRAGVFRIAPPVHVREHVLITIENLVRPEMRRRPLARTRLA